MTGSWKKGGQNLGGSFLVSAQHNSYLDQMKINCDITQSHYYDSKYSNSYELSLQSLLAAHEMFSKGRLAGSEDLGLGCA